RLFSTHGGFLVEGGASYTVDADRAQLDRKGSFFGGASFARRVRGSSLMLFARQEVIPAFGLGVSRRDRRWGVRATRDIGRSWELRVAATQFYPSTPSTTEHVYARTEWV